MEKIMNLKVNMEAKILAASNVVIVPHNGIDFDAIGSAVGLSSIVRKLKKQPIIVVDDPIYKMDHGVGLVIEDAKKETIILTREKYLQAKDDKDLYILTDVNKSYMVSIPECLGNPDNVIIIDHHNEDDKTVLSNEKCIDPSMSSASEIVLHLLSLFKCKCSVDSANYLLTGIYLDTNKLTKNVTPNTMKAVAKLLEMGASINVVTDLLSEDFFSDRRVQSLVSRAKIDTYSIATILAEESEFYTKEELAKAADYLLKYRVDAAFAIGKIDDDTISISARSKERINVGEVMSELEGGGNRYSAATKLSNISIEEVGKRLVKLLTPKSYVEN